MGDTTSDTPVSMSRSIRDMVKERLSSASDAVKAAIVDSFVKDETERRVKATTTVLEKLEAAELEIRKIKPQYAGFSADGQPVGEPFYSKEQAENLKKANEMVGKLNTALENALNKGDFQKVFELAGK